MLQRSVFTLLLFLCWSLCLFSQGPAAAGGQVKAAGKGLPGAVVELRKDAAVVETTTTDDDGQFLFTVPVEPGMQVSVRMFGFQTATQTLSDLSKPLAVQLLLQARRPAAGGPPRRDAQPEESLTAGTLPQATMQQGGEANEAGDAILVQGSLSRGLANPGGEAVSDQFLMAQLGRAGFEVSEMGFGQVPGMQGGFGGGEAGQQGGGQGGDPGGRQGGGPGGFGGRGGGPGGGPGGGFGGGPPGGGRGPGGFGGPRGPGGERGPRGGGPDPAARERLANMTPEQREEFRRRIMNRARQGALNEGFGNRRAQTRSQIRGTASYSIRNDAFDATPFSLNGRAVQKPDYAQNRFSLTLGGPVHLGKILPVDKSTFSFSYAFSRGRNPYSGFAIMPTQAQRDGDFTGGATIYDPTTRQPFPGNIIPASRISSIAKGLLTFIPTPNSTGATQNYRFIAAQISSSDNLSGRLSRTLNSKNRLAYSGGWQRRSGESIQPYGYRDPTSGNGHNHDITLTHTFSPRFLTNTRLRYNFNRTALTPFFAGGADVSGQLGIQGNSREAANFGPPNLNFTNYGDLTDGNQTLRRVHTYNFNQGLTLVKGKHSITAAVELTRLHWNHVLEQNARGTLFFGGLSTSGLDANGSPIARTGNDFAEFLLGLPQQSSLRAGGADAYLRQTQYAAFVQDEWKVHRKLSVNLGLRYEDWEPFTETRGRLTNLVFNSARNAVTQVTGNNLIRPDRNNFSPRIGIAWKPFGKRRTTLRGGYSLFYDGTVYSRIPTRLGWQPPFAESAQFNTTASAPLTLAQPFNGPTSVTIRNTNAVNPDYLVPQAHTWNLSVQEDFRRTWALEFGYIGTNGNGLLVQRLPNRAAPGSPTTSEQRRPIANALGFTWDSPEADSIFHSGQIRVTRRMARGLGFNALYTISKSLDNASTMGGAGNVVVQDDNNLAAERGRSSFDRRHVLTLSGTLMSPFGPRGFALRQNSPVTKVLRDWSIQTNMTAHSGTVFTARVLGAAADAAGTGATGSARADSTGADLNAGNGFFNTAAFALPPSTRYGNAGRNTIDGPSQVVLSASVGRTFALGDQRRSIDVRLSAENALNHVNITGLGTVVNSANYGIGTQAGEMRSMQLQFRFRF